MKNGVSNRSRGIEQIEDVHWFHFGEAGTIEFAAIGIFQRFRGKTWWQSASW